MTVTLFEEVLMGLDEVKVSLEQAVVILEGLVDDIPPHLGHDLKEVLTRELCHPLQSRLALLDALLDKVTMMA
jgi:hypothetical protein